MSMCNNVMVNMLWVNTAHCHVQGVGVVDVFSVVSPHYFSSSLLDLSNKL